MSAAPVPPPSRPARPRLATRLVGPAIGLVVAGFCAASITMLYDMRQDTRHRAVIGQNNLLNALSEDIARNIEIFDLSLQAVVDGVAEPELAGLSPRLQDLLLYDRAASAKHLGAILVLDRNGRVVRGSKPGAIGADLADREYFKAQRDDPNRGLFISAPFRRRVTGDDEVIGLSRRLNAPDGSFAGVVVGTMRLSYFKDLFSRADLGAEGMITLLRLDGTCLMRTPSAATAIGRSFAENPNFRSYLRTGTALFTGSPSSDGVMRMHDFAHVGDLPLVLNVALAENDVYASWRSKCVALAVALTVLCAAAAALWRHLRRQMRRTEAAEREASLSGSQYRLLAENAQDVIIRLDRSLLRTYVSPAVSAVLGYAPDDLVGGSPEGIVHPEDWPSVLGLIAAAQAHATDTEATYRLRHRDGHYVWMEGRYSSVPEDGGFIVVLRDITRRKAAEEKLAALNAELILFASTDALTGLANRRRFDEVLEAEVRRAVREAVPLSLLLIDVDRFKLYNDAYGHPEGDACLRAVAAVIGSVARRAIDLAARYGGEEFAVILPGTDEAGAAEVAERIRAAVARLARPHAGSAASGGVVTVSVGCATAYTRDARGAEAAGLVSTADRHLYEAKRTGRNRVVSAPPTVPIAPAPSEEERRLAVLAVYEACGAADPSASLDAVAAIAARMLGAPVGFVSLVGDGDVALVGRHGLDLVGAPREQTYCAHTILGEEPLVVPDTRADPRFADNPFTLDGVAFYAGAPLTSPLEGRRLGALCVADTRARPAFDDRQRALLADLARIAMEDIERRRLAASRPDAVASAAA